MKLVRYLIVGKHTFAGTWQFLFLNERSGMVVEMIIISTLENMPIQIYWKFYHQKKEIIR